MTIIYGIEYFCLFDACNALSKQINYANFMSGYSNQEFPKTSTSTSTSTETTSLDNDNKIWSLQFEVDTMQLYSLQRASHFQFIRNFISILTLIFSSTAFYSITASYTKFVMFSSIMITIFTLVDIVYNFADKHALHFDLYKRYHKLLSKMEIGEVEHYIDAKKQYNDIAVEQTELYYKALGVWCHNQICAAKGIDSKEMYRISFWQKMFKNVNRFDDLEFHKK